MIFRCGGWDEVVVNQNRVDGCPFGVAVTKRPRGLCGVAAHRRDAEPILLFSWVI